MNLKNKVGKDQRNITYLIKDNSVKNADERHIPKFQSNIFIRCLAF